MPRGAARFLASGEWYNLCLIGAVPFSFAALSPRVQALLDRFVPPDLRDDAEGRRRSQLFVLFSVVGFGFGLLFGGFYVLIGHFWGAGIVFACTSALAAGPFVVRGAGLERAANLYAFVLVLGFAALTAIEGGIYGHAVAWLAVLPLCTSILVGERTCLRWSAICFALMLAFCVFDVAGHTFPRLYAPRWESLITAAGYLSLTVFMSIVGITYERGRRRALTKLHGALEALSDANAQLQHLGRERSEFLGMAAHDLRTPLNSISGFAQLIQSFSPDMPEFQRDSLERILAASTRMRDLLDRLLSVRAIEEGKLELKSENCDLGVLAASLTDNQKLAAAAKNISLTFVPPAGIVWAQADLASTAQIIDNLVSNALKFSPRGGAVTLRVSRVGDQAAIEVQDSGPGLSEDDQRKLYGKFARLSAQPTGGESSNGLGLSIAKRLAGSMGGDLVCRSKLGEGATFVLTLPAAAAPKALRGPAAFGDELEIDPGIFEAFPEEDPVSARNS
jgi:signal transduction histidine kinase